MWRPLSGNSIKPRSSTFFNSQETVEIGRKELDMLGRAAMRDSLKRARLCLHKSHNDKVQEMLIAVCRGSYICPHRHLNKSESFCIIKGALLVVFFDNEGKVIRRIRMGSYDSNLTFAYRSSRKSWHTVVPLSDIVFYIETTSGPFVREETEFAPWGPKENHSDKIKTFLKQLQVKEIP